MAKKKVPSSRRANLVSRGVLKVRRSDSEVKRNAEIGLFTKPSALENQQSGIGVHMVFEFNGKKPKIGKNVFIAPTATVVGDVEIGDGASIWYGTVVRGDSNYLKIGKNTNIQDNSTIHTDRSGPTIIGENVAVGHNVVIHGCTIEDHCLIGIGALVLNQALVKKGSVVAAGSLVKPGQTIGPHHMVMGNPATFRKDVTDTELIDRPVTSYLQLAKEHMTVREMKGFSP